MSTVPLSLCHQPHSYLSNDAAPTQIDPLSLHDALPISRVLVLANVSDHPAHVLAETLSGFQTAAPDLLTDTGGRPARGDGAAGPRRGVAAGDRVPGGHLSGRGKLRATARPLNGAGGRAAGDGTMDPWLIPSRTSPRRSP